MSTNENKIKILEIVIRYFEQEPIEFNNYSKLRYMVMV